MLTFLFHKFSSFTPPPHPSGSERQEISIWPATYHQYCAPPGSFFHVGVSQGQFWLQTTNSRGTWAVDGDLIFWDISCRTRCTPLPRFQHHPDNRSARRQHQRTSRTMLARQLRMTSQLAADFTDARHGRAERLSCRTIICDPLQFKIFIIFFSLFLQFVGFSWSSMVSFLHFIFISFKLF